MRKIQFLYHLLDQNNNFIKQLFNVESCTVMYNSLTTIKSTANITMLDVGESYLNKRIQVICKLNNTMNSIGVFLVTNPNRTKENELSKLIIDMYSPIVLLERDKVDTRYYITKGTNIINAVKSLCGTHLINIPTSSQTLGADKEYEIGTPKITIINDLLGVANYTSLYITNDGIMAAAPYILPTDREIGVSYEAGHGSILHTQIRENMSLFDVPNVFVRFTNNAEINPPLIARYENNNADSPSSTVNMPKNVDVQAVNNISDLATLQAKCKRDAYNASQIYNTIEFTSAINPNHNYLECIWLKYGELEGKYIETNWSIECKVGGQMRHTARKVVTI